MYIPPLTARTCPVIYAASSDARKHTAAATSSARAEPPERNLRRPVDLRLLRDRARHVGVDQARRHHVHRDAARRHLARQRLGEPDQPRLRRGVVASARRCPSARPPS